MTAAPAATQFEGSLTGRGSHSTFPRDPPLLDHGQITGAPLSPVWLPAPRSEADALRATLRRRGEGGGRVSPRGRAATRSSQTPFQDLTWVGEFDGPPEPS